jgi:hypothetical protein
MVAATRATPATRMFRLENDFADWFSDILVFLLVSFLGVCCKVELL